jgi:hypothetical protein
MSSSSAVVVDPRLVVPAGTTVEVEGIGKMTFRDPTPLFAAVGLVRCFHSREIVICNDSDAEKLTIIEADQQKRFIRVRVSE